MAPCRYDNVQGDWYVGKNDSVADMVMWLGLAMMMTGTVVSFIGLGEKGFRTRHLRFLGPVLIGTGLSLCLLRVALCCCCCCFTANSTYSPFIDASLTSASYDPSSRDPSPLIKSE